MEKERVVNGTEWGPLQTSSTEKGKDEVDGVVEIGPEKPSVEDLRSRDVMIAGMI